MTTEQKALFMNIKQQLRTLTEGITNNIQRTEHGKMTEADILALADSNKQLLSAARRLQDSLRRLEGNY